jgi:hypothetical protein
VGGLSSPLVNEFLERADRCRQSGRPEAASYFKLLVVGSGDAIHNLRAGEGFIAGLCTLFMNPARVYQLVDQLRQDFEAGAACKRDTCKALGCPAFATTNQKAGVRISQGAPLILEADSCSEMNRWSFRPFASIPRNNRVSENFFDGITKPKAYASSEVSG